MNIYGIDFTSAPSRRKPIAVACGELNCGLIAFSGFQTLSTLQAFEQFLTTKGPWVGGFDFPFSQPEKLIENIGFPTGWTDMMAAFSKLDREGLESLLNNYRAGRPPGDKQHLRKTDAIAKSISPMMIYGVPVAKMFHTGAVALWRTDIHIPGLRKSGDSRVALEIYPALLARRFIGKASYKTDTKSRDTEDQLVNRQKILKGILTESSRYFGIQASIPKCEQDQIVADFRGDLLDATSAALTAAWAAGESGYGVPSGVGELEGWIVDPELRL